MAVTRESLIEFLKKELRLNVDELGDSTLIFSTGIADSFMLMSVLSFIEKQQGAHVDFVDVTLENLDSIERILAFAEKLKPA
jgi:acyl carrier protein